MRNTLSHLKRTFSSQGSRCYVTSNYENPSNNFKYSIKIERNIIGLTLIYFQITTIKYFNNNYIM
ncbi:hypothetical protein rsdtw13_01070 [Clostridium sp. TW13]|uniref:Uncharacterized protein n=1 Tax=Inconstantimicrobium mannanitabidum TaxID=1604901 RepID=A0ACB5R747_9CLOT|nr:hypothetical protein rsdtw13_01070 [Clostridium sp. TW13]